MWHEKTHSESVKHREHPLSIRKPRSINNCPDAFSSHLVYEQHGDSPAGKHLSPISPAARLFSSFQCFCVFFHLVKSWSGVGISFRAPDSAKVFRCHSRARADMFASRSIAQKHSSVTRQWPTSRGGLPTWHLPHLPKQYRHLTHLVCVL